MKLLIIFLFFLLTSCSSINIDFQKAISFGEIKELNEYSEGVDKKLFIRLWSAPIYKENCFVETHGICQYQYFITVSTFDEYPDMNIYRLKETGEIKNIRWLNSSNIDTAIVELKVANYTKEALENNPGLISKIRDIKIIVTPSLIKESLTNF